MNLRDLFANPPARYRGAPFWSWNDRLDAAELARQVQEMRAHGMGGFFMHSREGLETGYLGAEWMACIRATVQAAKAAGMQAWLYDEDRWPSGFAGGLVPAQGDAFRAKLLTLEATAAYDPAAATAAGADSGAPLALFRARLDGRRLLAAERLPTNQAASIREDSGEILLPFYRRIVAPHEWFNDESYADNLNPAAVAAFIASTYEPYAREVGAEFGGVVPGIFTDEPNVDGEWSHTHLPRIPWSDGLDADFAAWRGYDLLNCLPHLFFESDLSAQTRHDFWWVISRRYTTAYSQQLGAWCAAHGLAFTGHYLCENDLGVGVLRGGALMPHYQHQHVPGIDMLTVQDDENLTIKQCTSVAHQFGREFVLSETYGCSGWEMTFEEQKWVGDWQYALGVSMRCQHLALYSLRGCRKRDYPPSFNYNTSWWAYNGVVEDYFARVGLLTTQGQAVRDVLVLHPVATAWAMIGDLTDANGGVEAANAYGRRLNAFTRVLLAAHYDFDFGDEQILAPHAAVTGDELRVNQAAYRLLIVPPGMRTLLASTVDLLERYLDAGGRLLVCDPAPAECEARPDERVTALFARPEVTHMAEESALLPALAALLPRRVSLRDDYAREASEFLVMQRRAGERVIYFVVNHDRRAAHRLHLTLEGQGRLEEWNPLTGAITPLAAAAQAGRVAFDAHFAPAESRLYVVDATQPPFVESAAPHATSRRTTWLGPVYRFRRTTPNVLTLDVCRYRLGDSAWSAPLPVWEAQQAVRAALDMRPIYYNGLPQRYRWISQPHPQDGAPVEFAFEFTVRDTLAAPPALLLEGAADFRLTLDGAPIANAPVGWFLDRSFEQIPLPPLSAGHHTLTLACAYRNAMEVEDCFLLGDFAVDAHRALMAEPETLRCGDWTLQGYPHYPGGMIYLETVDYAPERDGRLTLTLGEHSATTVALHVNGACVGHIPWRAANGFDLTPHLRPGPNELGIEVLGSPRNMLGPLHQKAGRTPWTDCWSFRRQGADYTPDYVLHPYGLLAPVSIDMAQAVGSTSRIGMSSD